MDIQKILCIKDSGYNTNITITDDNYCHQVQKKKYWYCFAFQHENCSAKIITEVNLP
jgi:hypothetical protein